MDAFSFILKKESKNPFVISLLYFSNKNVLFTLGLISEHGVLMMVEPNFFSLCVSFQQIAGGVVTQ